MPIITRVFLVVALAACSQAVGHTIFADDFESYGSTAAMNAVWNNGGTATLSQTTGNPGKSFIHPGVSASFSGGNTNTVDIPHVTVPTGEVLRLSVDINDDGFIPQNSLANKRTTIGMRSGSANIIEMGMYNDPAGYAYRLVNFASGNPNWVTFTDLVSDTGASIDNQPIPGWHRFSVTFTEDSATFTLDLGTTGIINATATEPVTLNSAGFSQIRLGGPSDVSSLSGGVYFDNVLLETVAVPEPTSAAMLFIGGLALNRRR